MYLCLCLNHQYFNSLIFGLKRPGYTVLCNQTYNFTQFLVEEWDCNLISSSQLQWSSFLMDVDVIYPSLRLFHVWLEF